MTEILDNRHLWITIEKETSLKVMNSYGKNEIYWLLFTEGPHLFETGRLREFSCRIAATSDSDAERQALAIGRDFYDRKMEVEEYRTYLEKNKETIINGK